MLIIVDELCFRSACVASLLAAHPETAFSKICIASPRDLINGKFDTDISGGGLAILTYHVGCRPLSDPYVDSAIKSCIKKAAGRPVAVLSDAVDDAEISAAIRLGVNGLLPTDMAADAVVAALRFIKVGGKFFPPISEHRMSDSPTRIQGESLMNALADPKAHSHPEGDKRSEMESREQPPFQRV